MAKEQQPGIGVGIAIIRNNKVLMGHRTRNKGMSSFTGEDTWTFPGGKCRKWETLIENILREVREETGLSLDPERLEIISVKDMMEKEKDAHYVTIGFKYEAAPDEKLAPEVTEPEEIDRWEWFDINGGLPSSIFGPTRQMMETAGWL